MRRVNYIISLLLMSIILFDINCIESFKNEQIAIKDRVMDNPYWVLDNRIDDKRRSIS